MSEITFPLFCKKGHNTTTAGWSLSGLCRMCGREATKRKRLNNLEHYRQKDREAYYTTTRPRNRAWAKQGIKNKLGNSFSTLDFDRCYQIQKGCCKICQKHQSTLNKALSVDHDHLTGLFRGLVCQGCNIKIGSVESKEYKQVVLYLNLEVR